MGVFEIHLVWLFNAADIALITIFSLKSAQIFWQLYARRSAPVWPDTWAGSMPPKSAAWPGET